MCLASVMNRRRNPIVALVVLAMLALLGGCAWPTVAPVKLRAIKTESLTLMARYPIKPPEESVEVPKSQWPHVIASLEPEAVTVHKWGVDIWIKPYFDGGWGYHVPRNERDLPRSREYYWEPGDGVFWYGPL